MKDLIDTLKEREEKQQKEILALKDAIVALQLAKHSNTQTHSSLVLKESNKSIPKETGTDLGNNEQASSVNTTQGNNIKSKENINSPANQKQKTVTNNENITAQNAEANSPITSAADSSNAASKTEVQLKESSVVQQSPNV